jgi:hypothetical protein
MARLPPAAASGEALRIEGEPDVPDWRPSPIQARARNALLDQVVGRTHVDHLGRTRIADRAGAAHEQQRVLVDLERRIVDPVMIVLRPVEHHGLALEHAGMRRIVEVALAEFLADHAGLHDGVVEQIAAQHEEAGLLS